MRAERVVHWVLRVGAAACFVGHGAFGLLRKPAWLEYFAVFGIGPDAAHWLMPLIGSVDIAVGLAVLLQPRPVLLAWMTAWGLWTALLRPIAGDSAWELWERAGNFGVPLALLVGAGIPRTRAGWLAVLRPGDSSGLRTAAVARTLAATTAMLLLGHGALALERKALLVEHAALLSPGHASAVATALGLLEVLAAVAVALRPGVTLGIVLCSWKLVTESLFLFAGAPVWEFIERGGSYAAPLALALLSLAGVRGTLLPERLGVPLRRSAALALLIASPIAAGEAQEAATAGAAVSDAELLARLRRGGLVLACRHAATDDGHDAMPLDVDNRESQRNLNARGVAQAQEIGAAIRLAGIPIGRVLAGPMFRTYESAVHTFGAAEKSPALHLGHGDEFRALLREGAPDDRNVALVTHNALLMAGFRPQQVRMQWGDCLVTEIVLGEPRILRQLTPAAWTALVARGGTPEVSP